MRGMWNLLRVVAMLALGVSAFINMIVALLLLVGSGLVYKLGGDPSHAQQFAISYGALAGAAMVATAYLSNAQKIAAPIAGSLLVIGGLVAGARSGFDWLAWFNIGGGALALVGWWQLRQVERTEAALR
jgi:hypothetical protein